MKLSEIAVGKEYGVVPSWLSNDKSSRDPLQARESQLVKATLVSVSKYEYDSGTRKNDPNDFPLTPQGSKMGAVLVKAPNGSGEDVYWTSRLTDVVAEWTTLEARWVVENAKQEEEARLADERHRKERQIREQVDASVQQAKETLIQTAKELLGATNTQYVRIDTSGYGEEYRGEVTIPLEQFETLIELAYSGKE